MSVTILALILLPLAFGQAGPIGPQPPFSQPSQMVLNPNTNKLYVFGSGGPSGSTIAVVDTNTKKVLTYIDDPGGSQFGVGMMEVDPLANKIYFLSIGNLSVIDGSTDKIVQTVSLGLGVATTGVLEQRTQKFYLVGSTGITVLAAGTLTKLAFITGINNPTPVGPSRLVVNPANDKIYAFFDFVTLTGIQVIDSNTDRVKVQTSCAVGTGCQPSVPGFPIYALLNSADNSVWIFSDTTAAPVVGIPEEGSGPIPNPPATTMTRLDSATDLLTESHRVYGRFDGTFGIDPISRFVLGIGTYLPHVATPVPSISVGGPLTDTGTEPALAYFNASDPARLVDVWIDSHFLSLPPNSGFFCGTGTPAALGIVGVDLSAGNVFWRCDPTISTGASIVVSKLSFIPTAAPLLPPEVFSQQVHQLQIPLRFPINPVTTSPVVYDPLHRAFLLSQLGSSLVVVDPVASTADVVGLANPLFVPPAPTSFKVSGRVVNGTAGVPGIVLALSNGATTATDSLGNFSFASVPIGTYTLAIATPGLFTATPSQLVTVTSANVNGIAFAVLTSPIKVVNVVWSLGTALGPGGSSQGTIQLDQAAPASLVLTLNSSNSKALKVPLTVSVPAGGTKAVFSAQANGVSAISSSVVTATYQGAFAPAGSSSASPPISVYPADTVHVTKATWSQSSHVLAVSATDNNPAAVMNLLSAVNNQQIGNMANLGAGNYSYQQVIATNPGSIKVISNIGGNTGAGVTIVP